jgi:hypothetical protein
MGTITKIRGNKPQNTEERIEFIAEPWWNKEVEGIIETGKRLIMIKEDVDRGEWLKILKSRDLFGEDTAQRCMAIARNPILSIPANGRYLPRSLNTLYELTQISDDRLSEYIKDGRIYPELTREKAIDLKGLEDRKEDYRQILIINAHHARELSLADCAGHHDCSILKGDVRQEELDAVREGKDAWADLENELLKQRSLK